MTDVEQAIARGFARADAAFARATQRVAGMIHPIHYDLMTLRRTIRSLHDQLRTTTDKDAVTEVWLGLIELEKDMAALVTWAGQLITHFDTEGQ